MLIMDCSRRCTYTVRLQGAKWKRFIFLPSNCSRPTLYYVIIIMQSSIQIFIYFLSKRKPGNPIILYVFNTILYAIENRIRAYSDFHLSRVSCSFVFNNIVPNFVVLFFRESQIDEITVTKIMLKYRSAVSHVYNSM